MDRRGSGQGQRKVRERCGSNRREVKSPRVVEKDGDEPQVKIPGRRVLRRMMMECKLAKSAKKDVMH